MQKVTAPHTVLTRTAYVLPKETSPMGNHTEILVVGINGNWKDEVQATIPSGYTLIKRNDKIDAFDLLFIDERQFGLCIVDNYLGEKNEGLEILRELRDDGQTCPFIIYSDLIDNTSIAHAQALDGIVIKRNDGDTSELQRVVLQLLHVTV